VDEGDGAPGERAQQDKVQPVSNERQEARSLQGEAEAQDLRQRLPSPAPYCPNRHRPVLVRNRYGK